MVSVGVSSPSSFLKALCTSVAAHISVELVVVLGHLCFLCLVLSVRLVDWNMPAVWLCCLTDDTQVADLWPLEHSHAPAVKPLSHLLPFEDIFFCQGSLYISFDTDPVKLDFFCYCWRLLSPLMLRLHFALHWLYAGSQLPPIDCVFVCLSAPLRPSRWVSLALINSVSSELVILSIFSPTARVINI